jgi:hypothetical protein
MLKYIGVIIMGLLIAPTLAQNIMGKKITVVKPQRIYSWNILPPVQYDYPYEGKVYVNRMLQGSAVYTFCGAPQEDDALLACAHAWPKHCTLTVAPESVFKEYLNRLWYRYGSGIITLPLLKEVVIRHEHGHCNGWLGKHMGMRTYDGPLSETARAKYEGLSDIE